MITRLAIGALALGGAAVAEEAEIVRVNPTSLAAFLQSEGYRAKMIADDDGGPATIQTSSSGWDFYIDFVDCEGGACGRISFFASFNMEDSEGIDLAKVNEWNFSQWGQVSLDDENDPRIEFLFNTEGGTTRDALLDTIELYAGQLGRFAEFIDF